MLDQPFGTSQQPQQNHHLNKVAPEILQNQTKKSTPVNVIFKNISYTVQIEKKVDHFQLPCKKQTEPKHILKNVSGIFKAGEITAILGASGAGKTSLLNIIACRVAHKSEGKLYANTTEYSYDQFGDFANYVMQSDLLMQTLTVRETLAFAADLKIDASTEEKSKIVDDLSKNMKLEKCMDVMVGGSLVKGISGGEKKRTSIAFELISDPQVVMLDQPTSGLDSLTSYIIVEYLRKLAHNQGKTILMTIHQPNSQIYSKFDRLFLMIQGQLIYQGPANQAVEYFGTNFGLKCGQFVNPAEFLIYSVHQDNPQNVKRYPLYHSTYQSKQISIVQKEIQVIGNTTLEKRQMAISGWTTFTTLLGRDFKNIIRNPMLFKSRFFQSIVMGLYVGGVYWGAGREDYTVQIQWLAIAGFFFFMAITSLMSALAPVALVFPMERAVFLKQQNSRLYNVLPYFMSRNFIEIPYLIIMPFSFNLVFYWMIGLASTAQQFWLFYLVTFLINLCGNSLGLLLGSMITDQKSVSASIPLILLPFILFSGFFKNTGTLSSWIGWLQYISPLKYGFLTMTTNEVKYRASMVDQLNYDVGFWPSIGILFGLSFGYRFVSLFFLWLLRTRIQ